jgi:hypothetical protein
MLRFFSEWHDGTAYSTGKPKPIPVGKATVSANPYSSLACRWDAARDGIRLVRTNGSSGAVVSPREPAQPYFSLLAKFAFSDRTSALRLVAGSAPTVLVLRPATAPSLASSSTPTSAVRAVVCDLHGLHARRPEASRGRDSTRHRNSLGGIAAGSAGT